MVTSIFFCTLFPPLSKSPFSRVRYRSLRISPVGRETSCLHDHRNHTVSSAWRTRLATGSSGVQVGAQGIPSLVNNDGHPTKTSGAALGCSVLCSLRLNSEGVSHSLPRWEKAGQGTFSDCRSLLRPSPSCRAAI